jgi:peptidoglycan hydrolase-like protein with peptidoglycan-binding domain
MKCDAVETLQALLSVATEYNLEPDGSLSEDTEKALKEYQRKNGLHPDGICGKATWSSLLGV